MSVNYVVSILSATLLGLTFCTACGNDSGPQFDTAFDFETLVKEKTYRGAGWESETIGPREASSIVSPHGRVRVFFNDALVTSQQAGNGEFQGTPHDVESMAVKEFYEDDLLVGHAVYYKADTGRGLESFVYYCVGPEGRCLHDEPATTFESPVYGSAHDTNCHGCHGGLVFTQFGR